MAFHGVLGEDASDAKAIGELIRRIRKGLKLPEVQIKGHGFDGSSQLLRKGAAYLSAWVKAGCSRAVICYDADRDDPKGRQKIIQSKIIAASNVSAPCFAAVPVQELEAWLLADISALGELFNWCKGQHQLNKPETIQDPKETMKRLSRHPATRKYHYHPPTHNIYLAELVDIALIESRCPSFLALASFIRDEKAPARVAKKK